MGAAPGNRGSDDAAAVTEDRVWQTGQIVPVRWNWLHMTVMTARQAECSPRGWTTTQSAAQTRPSDCARDRRHVGDGISVAAVTGYRRSRGL